MGSCHLVMEGLTTHGAATRSEYCFAPLAPSFSLHSETFLRKEMGP